ncbi:LysR family transcriptional regulator [Mesorhizobium sp. B3-1-6]|uniref:LysR family transcriptional regulator n=1 Tax=Mesorhizobium sp. B3-1-6 TaxID=2589895 RepID=UPI00112AF01E|nr:LysR family transcriptional regulator [Mesorhizobium sp. B3-1-6]TPI41347.1 LysR family transcriptional regulator [Mesorhizobium sp. B3-1-6]
MRLTLAQLIAFERIVRLGSFHAAAQHIGLTQPSISQRIHELEDILGAQLFVRRGPKISVTAEGTALIAYADRMLQTATELSDRFRTRNPLMGLLRLGLTETFALICLPELLNRLESRYPSLKTSVQVGDTASLGKLFSEQVLDVAIMSEPDIDHDIRREPLGTNELSWYVGPNTNIPLGSLSPADLCAHHLIIPPPPARLYTTAMRWFSQAGATPLRLSMCNSLSVTIPTVINGLAVGLIPTRVMADRVARGEVRRLNVVPAMDGHRVSICYQPGEANSGLQEVIQLMRDLVAEYRLFV